MYTMHSAFLVPEAPGTSCKESNVFCRDYYDHTNQHEHQNWENCKSFAVIGLQHGQQATKHPQTHPTVGLELL